MLFAFLVGGFSFYVDFPIDFGVDKYASWYALVLQSTRKCLAK